MFTGGSLIVGAAARTDLVSPDRTEELARAQYASLRRLAELPDATEVWPTHGAGSFCSAPPGAERTSTVAAEKVRNVLLHAPDEEAHLSELGRLAELGAALPRGSATVMCGHGERAATAASMLERAGRHDLSILDGAPWEWAAATGRAVETLP